jgi:hypothetical protein
MPEFMAVPYSDLMDLDERCFKEEDCPKKPWSNDRLAQKLSTWLFDHEDDLERSRKRLKAHVPPMIYVMVLEYYIDGRNDT